RVVDRHRPKPLRVVGEHLAGGELLRIEGAAPLGVVVAGGADTDHETPPPMIPLPARRWSAMPHAVATFSESTPGAIGMRTRRSAAARVCSPSPGPSAPTMTASRRETRRSAAVAIASASGSGLSATRV